MRAISKSIFRREAGRVRGFALIGALVAGAPIAAAQGTVTDFQLPPGDEPSVEGPVVEGVVPPRPVATATPTPAPAPSPTATPTPTASPEPTEAPSPEPTDSPSPQPASTPAPAASEPAAQPTAATPPVETQETPAPAETAEAADTGASDAAPSIDLPAPIASVPDQMPVALEEDSTDWTGWLAWLGGALALIAVVAGAAVLVRRLMRSRQGISLVVPVVERPKLPPKPASTPEAAPAAPAAPAPTSAPAAAPAAAAETLAEEEIEEEDSVLPLRFLFEPAELSITLTAAALRYRLTISNVGEAELRQIAVQGDLMAAHSSLSQEEQMASASMPLPDLHQLEHLPAGTTQQVSGQLRLPLGQIRAIRKGQAALFVPLARLRLTDGAESLVQTLVLGQRSLSTSAGLQPFRLDLGPRIYREVTQKIFS